MNSFNEPTISMSFFHHTHFSLLSYRFRHYCCMGRPRWQILAEDIHRFRVRWFLALGSDLATSHSSIRLDPAGRPPKIDDKNIRDMHKLVWLSKWFSANEGLQNSPIGSFITPLSTKKWARTRYSSCMFALVTGMWSPSDFEGLRTSRTPESLKRGTPDSGPF